MTERGWERWFFGGVWTRLCCVALIAFAVLAVFSVPAVAQNLADDQTRLLDVRRAQLELRASRASLERTQRLFEENLVSRTELDRAELDLERAQLRYQESVLRLVSLQPHITVVEAVKYQDDAGRKRVRLKLKNSTPTFDDAQLELLRNFDGADPLPAQLRTRDVRDVYVSLQATAPTEGGDPMASGTTIGLPYERHLELLHYGSEVTLDFQLLRDVDSVLVSFLYNGQRRDSKIQLEQAETDSDVVVTAAQVSQEADLGAQVTYDLRLQRSSIDLRQFRLRLLNLPRQIGSTFLEPEGEARLSQLSFAAGVQRQNLRLRLFLPDRVGTAVELDQPLEFFAVVADEQSDSSFGDSDVTEAELRDSQAGYARLELTPRGIGEIELDAASLFAEMARGQTFETVVTVHNTGTRHLDNVTIEVEEPLRWRAEVEPDVLPTLEPNQEVDVRLLVVPSEDASIGDYEVRLKVEGVSFNQPVSAVEKTFRLRLAAGSNLVGLSVIAALLLILIVGVVVLGIRLYRR